MRKTLSIVLSVLVLTGVFVGSWYLSGGGSAPEQAGPAATADGNTDDTTPGSSVSGSTPAGSAEGSSGGSTGGTSGGSTGGSIPQATTRLTKPPHLGQLARDADALLRRLNVNPLAIGRIVTYTAVAYHDSYRDNTIAPLLVELPGGASAEDALTAAAIVLAEVSDVDALKKDAEGWLAELTPNTQAIVAAVIKRADADGFAQAASVKAPTFTGEPAWMPGNRTYPGGLEPGWGQLKPILVDSNKCPVAKAPFSTIAAERAKVLATLKESNFDRNKPEVAEALLEATGSVVLNAAIAFGEYNDTMQPFLKNDPLSPKMSMSLRALVGAYDATIALWNAKWTHGVAAPMDLYLADSTQPGLTTSAPSYPSTASTMTTLVAHLLKIQGGPALTEADLSSVKGVPMFKVFIETKNARAINWSADVKAGEALGRCMAEQIYASLNR